MAQVFSAYTQYSYILHSRTQPSMLLNVSLLSGFRCSIASSMSRWENPLWAALLPALRVSFGLKISSSASFVRPHCLWSDLPLSWSYSASVPYFFHKEWSHEVKRVPWQVDSTMSLRASSRRHLSASGYICVWQRCKYWIMNTRLTYLEPCLKTFQIIF